MNYILCFDVDIEDSLIPVYWILKYYGGGRQDSGLDLRDRVVKIGEGWLEQSALVSQGGVAKWVKYPTGWVINIPRKIGQTNDLRGQILSQILVK